jgi:hypothetical protein
LIKLTAEGGVPQFSMLQCAEFFQALQCTAAATLIKPTAEGGVPQFCMPQCAEFFQALQCTAAATLIKPTAGVPTLKFREEAVGSLLCSMLRVSTPGRDNHSSVLCRVGCVSSGSSSNDLERTGVSQSVKERTCVSQSVKERPEIKTEGKSRMLNEIKTEDQGFRLDEVGDHKVKTEGQDRRLKEVGDNKVIAGAHEGGSTQGCLQIGAHEEGSLEVSPGRSEGGDLAGLHSNCSESTDLSTSPRYTASEEAFNNSVLVQGRVVPPSSLKLRSAGAREDSEALYQGVVNHRDRPQIWQGKMLSIKHKDS